jgi:hypothetical protein
VIITIPYAPHMGQKILHSDTHRFKTIVCGRRFGKTVFAINELIKQAIKEVGNYWYIAPTYSQAKLIAWEKIKYYAVPEIRLGKPDETELQISLVNKSTIRLMGSDNPDRLRGVGIRGCILDEFASIKRNVWGEIIRPTLADTRGWAIFLGTPKGKLNQLYEMYIRDKDYKDRDFRNIDGLEIEPDSDFKSFRFKTIDNPYIDPLEVAKARIELAPQYYLQEWEASFENYTGIIYKELISEKHIISFAKEFIKKWWKVFIGIDTGRTSAISFVAIDDAGIAYVFDEIYDYDGIVANIAAGIQLKLNLWGIERSRCMFIIDSASQVKREYEAQRISLYDSEKDLDNQIAQVRNRLANNRLYFNRDCKMHIVEHLGYIWDEKAKKPAPLKENDHTCSAIQYIFSTYDTTASVDYQSKKKYENSLQYKTITPDNNNSAEKFS